MFLKYREWKSGKYREKKGWQPGKRKKWIILAGIFGAAALLPFLVAGISILPYWNLPSVTAEDLDDLQLGDCPNLMVVAHPDDELLWGGKHLLEGGYLVVCLTRGDDAVRRAEFEQVVSAAGCKGLILSYPDKIWKWRADLKLWQENIESDIAAILTYKDWDTVASHNADGEYGHQHHKFAHEAVAKEYQRTGCKASLYWFGKYYTNDRIPYSLPEMEKSIYNQTREIAKLYQSQRGTIRKMYHMLPYEHWEQARAGQGAQ